MCDETVWERIKREKKMKEDCQGGEKSMWRAVLYDVLKLMDAKTWRRGRRTPGQDLIKLRDGFLQRPDID